jgi:hypothetical protein
MKRIHRTFLATAMSIALLGGSLAVSAADLQLPPARFVMAGGVLTCRAGVRQPARECACRTVRNNQSGAKDFAARAA